MEAASVEDVNKAVAAARAALNHESWRDLTGSDRGKLMNRLADLIEQHAKKLVALEAWDSGKPYQTVLGLELPMVVGCIRYYAGWADKIHGQTIPTHSKKFAYTMRQPIGLCAQIIPWNYPLLMMAWKLGPALAAGNTIILKPAEQTPLSALYIADLIRAAGFPPGVVNVLNGYGRDVGHALASHLGVDKVAFTGATATGKVVQKAASVNLKNITLETGGKSALLVFDDADVQQAAKWAHIGIMGNQGQVCTANSRLLVQKGIYQSFIAEFVKIVKSLKVGNPFAADTFQGPQITREHYDKVLSYVGQGQREGAKLAAGGGSCGEKGYYIAPTVLADVLPHMKIYKEEIFGPVVAISPFSTEDQAIAMANDTEFGLAASLFTQNVERVHRVSSRLEAGMIWVNSSTDSDFRVPFGGVKQSGIGRELGEAGLDSYLQVKAVHINTGTRL